MVYVKEIKDLLSEMTNNEMENIRKIIKTFGSLNYVDEDNQSILHILVDDRYDENKCFLAIKSLLQNGFNPNLKDDFKYNFIQTALYAGYSEDFIIKIIEEALKYNLDVNHIDSDGDTIVHTAIYSDDYLGEVINIYKMLLKHNFDSSKMDNKGRNLLEAMIHERKQKHYTDSQITDFRMLFLEKKNQSMKESKLINEKQTIINTSASQLSEKGILELEQYGLILNKKKYFSSPTIGREKELKNLLITLLQEKKKPLIVGESGVGKTVIVDELAYRIQNNQVPKFLSNRIILEVTPSELVSGAEYVGQFEKKMTNLMNICEKYDVILFIDEIHTIYGVGSSKRQNLDMASILKHYLDRTNLKVIGTTTDKKYIEFFSDDDLKRRFEIISVKEPNLEILRQIINKVLEDYSLKYGITFRDDYIKEELVNIIIELTSKKHRDYKDVLNNPDLSVSIIDKAFAIASFYDSEFIEMDYFIESLSYCDRIYDAAKEQAICKLKSISPREAIVNKVLTLDFNKK